MINLTPNKAKIINCLKNMKEINELLNRSIEGLTYSQIHKETKLPITTIKDNLYALEKAGVIKRKTLKKNSKKGRPKTLWSMI